MKGLRENACPNGQAESQAEELPELAVVSLITPAIQKCKDADVLIEHGLIMEETLLSLVRGI